MSLLERIKASNKERKEIQDLLENIENYYTTPYSEMYEYYGAMKQKSAEKFIEGWLHFKLALRKKMR